MSETNFFCCLPIFNNKKNKLQSQSIQNVGNFKVTINVTIEPISKIDNSQLPMVKINLNEEKNKEIVALTEVLNKPSVPETILADEVKVVQVPVVVQEVPVVVQEVPVVVQEVPVVVQEVPIVVQEVPVVVEEVPVVVEEVPVVVQEVPVVVQEVPVVVEEVPIVVEEVPVVVEEVPVVVEEVSITLLNEVSIESSIKAPIEESVLPIMAESTNTIVPSVKILVDELVKSIANNNQNVDSIEDDSSKKKEIKTKNNFRNSKRTRGKKIIL